MAPRARFHTHKQVIVIHRLGRRLEHSWVQNAATGRPDNNHRGEPPQQRKYSLAYLREPIQDNRGFVPADGGFCLLWELSMVTMRVELGAWTMAGEHAV